MAFAPNEDQRRALVRVAEGAGLQGALARDAVAEVFRHTPTPPNMDQAVRQVRGLAKMRRQAQTHRYR